MRVGVFDSGVGGLTVVKSLIQQKIFKEIVYYGDTARVPYGTKNKNTIIRYSLEALNFFDNLNCDLMIIACNSATAYAINEVRKKAKFDVYGVIEPGVLAVKNYTKKKQVNILVIGTSATINSNKYQKLLQKYNFYNIKALPTPLLVPIVEENIKDKHIIKATFDYYFKNISQPDIIILGCTHFPLLSKEISSYFHKVKLIHSGDAIVEYLKKNGIKDKKYKKTKLKTFCFRQHRQTTKYSKSMA